MANKKKTYSEPKKMTSQKSTKVYQEKKLGWIDRLTIYFAKKMDKADTSEYPPVSNIRRLFGYLIDFLLSNLLACIPLVLIQSMVNDSTYVTQDLRIVELPVAYVIVACALLLYIFYYVYIPYKIWPGQTPGKKFLSYKIVMMDNSPVTLKALFLRNVLVLILVEGAAMFITTYIVQLTFLTLGFELIPDWVSNVFYFTTGLSVMVTLTNPYRRMFHDLVAGTKLYKIDDQKEQYTSF